jgi:hypothetical protein
LSSAQRATRTLPDVTFTAQGLLPNHPLEYPQP